MLIGELAERTGVPTRTLRFYEHRGLLHPPARTDAGYRVYEEGVADRVAFIRRAQAAGLTLAQIGETLAVSDGGRRPCEHVARQVETRLEEVEQRLADLEATRRELFELSLRLDALEPEDCRPDAICAAIDTP